MKLPSPTITGKLHGLRRLTRVFEEPATDSTPGEASLPHRGESTDRADLPPPIELYRQTGRTTGEVFVDLLHHHDGHLPQREIVEHTGWAKSTVSEELQRLEQEEVLTRIPLGREKLVYLPDHIPEAAHSPRHH